MSHATKRQLRWRRRRFTSPRWIFPLFNKRGPIDRLSPFLVFLKTSNAFTRTKFAVADIRFPPPPLQSTLPPPIIYLERRIPLIVTKDSPHENFHHRFFRPPIDESWLISRHDCSVSTPRASILQGVVLSAFLTFLKSSVPLSVKGNAVAVVPDTGLLREG